MPKKKQQKKKKVKAKDKQHKNMCEFGEAEILQVMGGAHCERPGAIRALKKCAGSIDDAIKVVESEGVKPCEDANPYMKAMKAMSAPADMRSHITRPMRRPARMGRNGTGMGAHGFTCGEEQALLAQGVKPWDADAHAVLAALRNL